MSILTTSSAAVSKGSFSGGGSDSPCDAVTNSDEFKQMQAAFAKTKPFDKPVTAFRGMNMAPEQLKSFLTQLKQSHTSGKPITMKGMISTTTDPDAAEDFTGNVEIRIVAKRGIDVKSLSDVPGEDELLLNHGSQFKVLKGKQENGKWVIELEQVEGNEKSREKGPFDLVNVRNVKNDTSSPASKFVDNDASAFDFDPKEEDQNLGDLSDDELGQLVGDEKEEEDKSIDKCDHGPNKGKPGPCPENDITTESGRKDSVGVGSAIIGAGKGAALATKLSLLSMSELQKLAEGYRMLMSGEMNRGSLISGLVSQFQKDPEQAPEDALKEIEAKREAEAKAKTDALATHLGSSPEETSKAVAAANKGDLKSAYDTLTMDGAEVGKTKEAVKNMATEYLSSKFAINDADERIKNQDWAGIEKLMAKQGAEASESQTFLAQLRKMTKSLKKSVDKAGDTKIYLQSKLKDMAFLAHKGNWGPLQDLIIETLEHIHYPRIISVTAQQIVNELRNRESRGYNLELWEAAIWSLLKNIPLQVEGWQQRPKSEDKSTFSRPTRGLAESYFKQHDMETLKELYRSLRDDDCPNLQSMIKEGGQTALRACYAIMTGNVDKLEGEARNELLRNKAIPNNDLQRFVQSHIKPLANILASGGSKGPAIDYLAEMIEKVGYKKDAVATARNWLDHWQLLLDNQNPYVDGQHPTPTWEYIIYQQLTNVILPELRANKDVSSLSGGTGGFTVPPGKAEIVDKLMVRLYRNKHGEELKRDSPTHAKTEHYEVTKANEKEMDKWLASKGWQEVGHELRDKLDKCDHGPNKGKPGPCPDTGKYSQTERVGGEPRWRDEISPRMSKEEVNKAISSHPGKQKIDSMIQGNRQEGDEHLVDHARETIAGLHPEVADWVSNRLEKINFNMTDEQMFERWPALKEKSEFGPNGLNVQGKELILNDDQDYSTVRGTFDHELAHTIDYSPFGRLSDTRHWKAAWQKDIVERKQITPYAQSSPTEGFAEFFRCVELHKRNGKLDEILQNFPNIVKFLEKEEVNLW